MICLTGCGYNLPVKGSYTYRFTSSKKNYFPELYKEEYTQTGRISFDKGNLTNGKNCATGWNSLRIIRQPVDIIFGFRIPYFIDHIILKQNTRCSDGKTTAALSRVQVFFPEKTDDAVCTAEGDPILTEKISMAAGVQAKQIIIRLETDCLDLVLSRVEIWGTAAEAGVSPFPVPQQISYKKNNQHFNFSSIPDVLTEDPAAEPAGVIFLNKFNRFFPYLKIKKHKPGKVIFRGGNVQSEGYSCSVAANEIIIIASDKKGFIYAVESLMQLFFLFRQHRKIPQVTLNDYPAKQIRGIHCGLPPRKEIPYFKRLIRDVWIPLKYNTLFLEIAGGMEYKSRPEINKVWIEKNKLLKNKPLLEQFPHGQMVAGGGVLTQDEVRDITEYAERYGLEVIPEVQSLSHVEYLTAAYPEIGEWPAESNEEKWNQQTEDKKPKERFASCYCPSTEKSFEVISDVLNEVIEVIKPKRYVHMGHDEVYHIGVCEKCRGKNPADLYSLHVMRMHTHLKNKNLGMMIWADMLHDCTKYKTPPALDTIPKDIILLDFIWYFHPERDLEDKLLERGFNVVMGNLYSSHYPRYALRSKKEGISGGQVSTWCRMDSRTLSSSGKIYDFMYTAQMLWHDGYQDALRLSYDRVLRALIPLFSTSEKLLASAGTNAVCSFLQKNVKKSSEPPFPSMTGTLRNFNWRTWNRPWYCVSGGDMLKINAKSGSLVFIHSTFRRHPPYGTDFYSRFTEPYRLIGYYLITYADGKKLKIPVCYGANIVSIDESVILPIKSFFFRHFGYMAADVVEPLCNTIYRGKKVYLHGWEWANPRPEKTIKYIQASNTQACPEGWSVHGIMAVNTSEAWRRLYS